MRTDPKLVVVFLVGSCLPLWAQSSSSSDTACDVTVPNGIVAGSSERQDSSYGNALSQSDPLGCGRTELSFSSRAEPAS